MFHCKTRDNRGEWQGSSEITLKRVIVDAARVTITLKHHKHWALVKIIRPIRTLSYVFILKCLIRTQCYKALWKITNFEKKWNALNLGQRQLNLKKIIKIRCHNADLVSLITLIFKDILEEVKDVRSCVLRTFLDRSSISQILHHISFLLVNLGFTMPIKLY